MTNGVGEWASACFGVWAGSIDFLTAECRQIRVSGREREGRDQSDKIRRKGWDGLVLTRSKGTGGQ